MTEDEMVGWHHKLDGHEFDQGPVRAGAALREHRNSPGEGERCSRGSGVMRRVDSLKKTLMLGGIGGKRRRGRDPVP